MSRISLLPMHHVGSFTWSLKICCGFQAPLFQISKSPLTLSPHIYYLVLPIKKHSYSCHIIVGDNELLILNLHAV